MITGLVGEWSSDAFLTGPPPQRQTHLATSVRVWVLRLALVLVVAQTVLHLVSALVFDLRIDRLNADLDSSVWGWTGVVSQFAAALGAGLLALQTRRHRRALVFLAAALAFLSMDDAVQVHERLGGLMTVLGPLSELNRVTWPIIYAPLMLTVFLVLWRVGGAVTARARALVRGGLVALGLAVVLEFVSPLLLQIGSWRGDPLYELEVVLEEAGELGGWLVVAAALLSTGLDVALRQATADAPASGLPDAG